MEKGDPHADISNFPILSYSFFIGLPSCSIIAPHATSTRKAKPTASLKKKVQPKSSKLPITSTTKGKQ